MDTPLDRSASSAEVETILARAARALGSIESPDFRRVKLNTQRYARLIAELSAICWIRETSDVNEDVSSVLRLRPNLAASAEYLLYISNVAEYAFVMKLHGTESHSDRTFDMLIGLLRRSGLNVLSKEVLSTPVAAMTFVSDHPRLFNVLFSDSDYLPWETADQDPDETAANDH